MVWYTHCWEYKGNVPMLELWSESLDIFTHVCTFVYRMHLESGIFWKTVANYNDYNNPNSHCIHNHSGQVLAWLYFSITYNSDTILHLVSTYTWLSAPFTQHSQSTVTVSGLNNTTELHLLCLADQIIAVVLVTVFAHCKVLRIRTHLQHHIW